MRSLAALQRVLDGRYLKHYLPVSDAKSLHLILQFSSFPITVAFRATLVICIQFYLKNADQGAVS